MLNRCLRRYPFSCFLIVAIVLLSLLPIPEVKMAEDIPLADKWTHMVMYGVLTLVLWLETWRARLPLSARKVCLFFLLPGEWLDFVANTLGVCIGTAVGSLVHLQGKRSRSSS